jgi:hypothetical protein
MACLLLSQLSENAQLAEFSFLSFNLKLTTDNEKPLIEVSLDQGVRR